MLYYSSDFFMMLVFIAVAFAVVVWMRRTMRKADSSSTASSTTKPKTSSKTQIAEDIKATKTSQVADAVSILDDLGSTSSTYRHYCELIGTSMASSGVIAPYSKRPVAYYDIKCYRIDATYNGGQKETLIAHEHSFDPFFFTDGSCDTPVYIDLESFGDNVILVNSTNHIEGPNSEFAKAVQQSTGSATSGTGSAYRMVARTVARGANALLGATQALRDALMPRPLSQLAFAEVGAGQAAPKAQRDPRGSNVMYSDGKHRDGRGVTSGRRPQSSAPSRQPQINIHVGYGNQMPGHLGSFMGPSHQPYVMGGGFTTHRPTSPTASDILLGMSLAALLNSMQSAQQTVTTTSSVTDTFRGYRLVENVVPLGSPIYCIGEVYRHGTDVYMSRSLAKDYPTSFFATKPESELLSAIGAVK